MQNVVFASVARRSLRRPILDTRFTIISTISDQNLLLGCLTVPARWRPCCKPKASQTNAGLGLAEAGLTVLRALAMLSCSATHLTSPFLMASFARSAKRCTPALARTLATTAVRP